MAYYKVVEDSAQKDKKTQLYGLTDDSLRIFRANNQKIEIDKKATLRKLQDKHKVFWDFASYYMPEMSTVANLKKIDHNNAWAVRDYLTCSLNDVYLRYCADKGITPKGLISIPEHFTNTFSEIIRNRDLLRMLNDTASMEDVLVKNLDKLTRKMVSRYIDERGSVHFTSYSKQIDASLSDLTRLRGSEKERMSQLLPDYSKDEPKFKFDEVVYAEKDREKYFKVLKNLEVAENLINMLIPPKYRICVEIEIGESRFAETDKKIVYIGLHDDYTEKIYLREASDAITIFHEYVHAVMDANWKYDSQEIAMAECDYFFEITKGKPIGDWKNENGEEVYKYKFLDAQGYGPIASYVTKLPKGKEVYSPRNEFLAMLCSKLTQHIIVDGDKIIDEYRNKKSSLKRIVSENFDSLIEHYPITLGALALSFFRGEFTK